MDIMTHAKFYFNRLMLTLIFAIRASEPPLRPGERLKRPGLIGLTLFRPGFFYRLKVQGGVFRDPLMISGTSKASQIKLCTVIVLLNTYQNTKRNFQKYDL